ncbi:Uncharacterised protein [Providencia rustigianii]|uniref:hypothetical protein n=1 Tax=Providencia alcalifaciens TaxID=126385 RepID=UPI000F6BC7F8|nr:Uncharacterised protein [Providencia rustigianii]
MNDWDDKDDPDDYKFYNFMKNIFAVIGLTITIGLFIGALSTKGFDIGSIKFGYNELFGLYFRVDV